MTKKLDTGSLLALDWGQKKVGVATCDSLGISITERPIVFRNRVPKDKIWELTLEDKKNLNTLVESFEPESLLFGVPYNADGSDAESTPKAKALGSEISVLLKLPVHFISEANSSWEAKGLLQSKDKKNDDSVAASLLVRDFLSQQKRKEGS